MDTKLKKFNKSLIPKTIAFLLAITMFALSVISVTSYFDQFQKKSNYNYEFFSYLLDEFLYDEDYIFEKSTGFLNKFSEVTTDTIRSFKVYADGSKEAYKKYQAEKKSSLDVNCKNYIKNQLAAILGDSGKGSPATILYLMEDNDSTDLLQKVGNHSKHYIKNGLFYNGDFYTQKKEYEDSSYYDAELDDYVATSVYLGTYESYLNFETREDDGVFTVFDGKYQSTGEIPASILSKVGKNDYVVELCNCHINGEGKTFDGYYKISMKELESYFEAHFGENFYHEKYSLYFDNYSEFKEGYTNFLNKLNAVKNLKIAVVDNKTKIAKSNDSSLDGKKFTSEDLNAFKKDGLSFSINLENGEKKVYKCDVLGKKASENSKEEYIDDLLYYATNGTAISSFVDYGGYDCTVYFSFDSKLTQHDVFYNIQKTYIDLKHITAKTFTVIGIYLLVMLACIIYLVIRSGRHSGDDELHMMRADSMFTLFRIALNCALIFGVGLAGAALMCAVWNNNFNLFFMNLLLGSCAALAMTFLIDLILYISRNIKNGTLIKNILIVRLVYKIIEKNKEKTEKPIIYRDIMNDVLKKFLLWIALPNIAVGLISVFFIGGDGFGFASFLLFLLFVYDVFIAVYACKYVYYIREIIRTVNKMRNGDYSIKINTQKMPTALKGFADDINSLNDGLRIAVENATRDERMKAELITNVSHDLKTPLTSIINYTDLLSRCDITDETAQSYINVLGEKSARLKKLIEDLVEASKASSGAMRVDLTQVSLNELAVQIAGEYNDDFEKRQLDLIMSESSENIIVTADGKLAYRAFDNLMGNVKKYAMANTRVYLDLSAENGLGIITLKNVSASKLNIPAEELMERFVRADSSRSTEGSGLGLSIAQNLCSLQGGSLDISISGDLFMAKISYPLADL